MNYEIISIRKRKTVQIKTPVDVYNAIKRYGTNKQEVFIVITVNGSHEIITIHIATIGLVNKTIIHPREIFKHAFIDNAVSVIIAHNHPTGLLLPSLEDIKLTEEIIEVSEIMEIPVIDHIIFNKKGYYSFKEYGKINNKEVQ